MLHDPEMECTCDKCGESVMLAMHWYVGGYDLEDADAERALVADHDWVCVDGGHLCGSCGTV